MENWKALIANGTPPMREFSTTKPVFSIRALALHYKNLENLKAKPCNLRKTTPGYNKVQMATEMVSCKTKDK